MSCLSYTPHLGTEPTTQACALTGNQTGDLLLCGTMTNHWATPVRVNSQLLSSQSVHLQDEEFKLQ